METAIWQIAFPAALMVVTLFFNYIGDAQPDCNARRAAIERARYSRAILLAARLIGHQKGRRVSSALI